MDEYLVLRPPFEPEGHGQRVRLPPSTRQMYGFCTASPSKSKIIWNVGTLCYAMDEDVTFTIDGGSRVATHLITNE